ncbi:MAG: hypothetical protein IJW47_00780, partial [Clostridia bacterium]|nr:hypothetical protein [Clostridia bacterium]
NEKGYVYAFINGDFQQLFSTKFSGNVKLIRVVYNGANALLCMSSSKSVILDSQNQEIEVNVPYGQYVAYFAGRLFVVKDNRVEFTDPFDFSGVGKGGFIQPDSSAGSIVGIEAMGDKIYLFCAYAIYSIEVNNALNEFVFKTVSTEYRNIKINSVRQGANGIYFLIGNTIYSFNGNKFEHLRSALEDFNLIASGEYYMSGYVYYIRVGITNSNQKYIYYRNVKSGAEFITEIKGTYYKDYGSCIDSLTFELMGFKYGGEKTICYNSAQTDLGVNSSKLLYSVSVRVTAPTTLKLHGDFGTKVYNLTEGNNEIFINLQTYLISFDIISTSTDNTVSGLNFKFTEKGE